MTLEADEATLDRLAALLLFSDLSAPCVPEPDVEWIPPVLFEEREEVRQWVRDALHAKAQKDGLPAAKALLAWAGCKGVRVATDEELALLRYYLKQGE